MNKPQKIKDAAKPKQETGGRLTSEKIMAMSEAERNKMVADLDVESTESLLARAKPLTAKQRALWSRVKKKMGRPVVGKGAKMVMVTMERGLLDKVDAFAKDNGLKRSELIARSLRQVIREGLATA
jgi:hypothetical protein